MAIINSLKNLAQVTFEGAEVLSNEVTTLLKLPPTVLKVVDKLTAAIGETLKYTVTITNVALEALTNVPFTDVASIIGLN